MSNAVFNYELYFDLSPDLLCIAGYDGYFKRINPAVSKVLGYSMEELYASPINDFVYQPDKGITALVRAELVNAKPLLNFENRYLRKDGTIVWLSWTSFPVPEEKLIFAIAKDITHKKNQEAERNTQLAHLTRVNKDLKQITFTTSHDLRSPVNNLLSIFSLLDMSKISDQETVELIEVIKLAGEKLKQTLNNYVDILKDKHSTHSVIEDVGLEESLAEVLQSIASLVKSSGATIDADFSAAPRVRFRRSYMDSVFLNLITNSIKYAKPGSNPRIKIHTEKGEGTVILIVEDEGIGFDTAKVRDIFGMQQRADQQDSSGVGLYLVYNQVTGLGGKIEVESNKNEGAKFIITFNV